MFQSTHPCGVRPPTSAPKSPQKVSIHAPVWGATGHTPLTPKAQNSFNPRTRVGCDNLHGFFMSVNLFQSTHPCGVRQWRGVQKGVLGVSIHAPVWGATFYSSFATGELGFNPRTRVGCDAVGVRFRNITKFQSTHPCGVRHPDKGIKSAIAVSIHAPVWGATRSRKPLPKRKIVSIHAPVWGATIQ